MTTATSQWTTLPALGDEAPEELTQAIRDLLDARRELDADRQALRSDPPEDAFATAQQIATDRLKLLQREAELREEIGAFYTQRQQELRGEADTARENAEATRAEIVSKLAAMGYPAETPTDRRHLETMADQHPDVHAAASALHAARHAASNALSEPERLNRRDLAAVEQQVERTLATLTG